MGDQTVAEPIRLTYEDFCALSDDGRRYEILDGDLYMSPSPVPFHQQVIGNLYAILRAHVRKHGLGRVYVAPLDVLLSAHDIVEPDLVFVANDGKARITRKNIEGPPDLLVEVLSQGNADRDTRDKRNIYARCGVPWYWIVDPDRRTVAELDLKEKAYVVTAEPSGNADFSPRLFPGLSIALSDLWE